MTVTGVNDAVADGNQPYSIVTASASSSDPGYNGLNPADVAVTNIDDDASGITVNPVERPGDHGSRRHGHVHGGAEHAADGDVTIGLPAAIRPKGR